MVTNRKPRDIIMLNTLNDNKLKIGPNKISKYIIIIIYNFDATTLVDP